MIIVTSDTIPGKRIVKTLGLTYGNTIRARHVGKDFLAFLKNLVGGEITEYTKMMAEAREQALDRMKDDAIRKGANAIVTMRFCSMEMMQNSAEVIAYGTAVIIEDE